MVITAVPEESTGRRNELAAWLGSEDPISAEPISLLKMLRIILLLVLLPMILGLLLTQLSQPILRWAGYSLLVIPPSIAMISLLDLI